MAEQYTYIFPYGGGLAHREDIKEAGYEAHTGSYKGAVITDCPPERLADIVSGCQALDGTIWTIPETKADSYINAKDMCSRVYMGHCGNVLLVVPDAEWSSPLPKFLRQWNKKRHSGQYYAMREGLNLKDENPEDAITDLGEVLKRPEN